MNGSKQKYRKLSPSEPNNADGFADFDEGRARTEICTLFEHQWDDAMVIGTAREAA